jgi:bifunctional ADP-heptose synthase (sugar kinase/adenylyltransferase)
VYDGRVDWPLGLTYSNDAMISLARLESLLAGFGGLRIALVGDLYLDRYLDIEPGVCERSIETGLEAYQVSRVRNSPGVVGTVMNNLAALGVGKVGGGRLVPVTVIGDDGHGDDLMRELLKLPVDPRHVLRDPARLTPTYTKPMQPVDAAGSVYRELNRLDVRTRAAIGEATRRELCERVRQAFDDCDGLIICDQVVETGWGVVSPEVRAHLRSLARERPEKLVFVDSRAHMGEFDFGTLKPNRAECLASIGVDAAVADKGDVLLRRAVAAMVERTGRPVFCTHSERGILVATPRHCRSGIPVPDGATMDSIALRPGGTPRTACDPSGTGVPDLPSGVIVSAPPVRGEIDIVGAGDSATAGIVASLLCGASEIEAAAVGNFVASITIEQLGTTGTATPGQVVARLREVTDSRTE